MRRLVIHGGCGVREDQRLAGSGLLKTYHDRLVPILEQGWRFFLTADVPEVESTTPPDHVVEQQSTRTSACKTNPASPALQTALFVARLLEDDPTFNAGTGSRVQRDGKIRMSASVMDGRSKSFAGVVNVEDVRYPSEVAVELLRRTGDRRYAGCREGSVTSPVLAGPEATAFAREVLKMPVCSVRTPHRQAEYEENRRRLEAGGDVEFETVGRVEKTGTIGVLVLDSRGDLVALTSTGGAGFETAGRVSDSPTVAGNYASEKLAVSCTGIGEQIVSHGLAVKLHTRVVDQAGKGDGNKSVLQAAVDKCMRESDQVGDYLGLIALSRDGEVVTGSTKLGSTLWAMHDGEKVRTFWNENVSTQNGLPC